MGQLACPKKPHATELRDRYTPLGSLLRVDLELEPAAQWMGRRQMDFSLQVLMAKA